MDHNRAFDYDVALSFAGEDRSYVARTAGALVQHRVKVFYDEYETVTMWGRDLYLHLRDIYQNRARYTVLFASKHYAQKLWTSHERASAQARALAERGEYILPVRFDDTEIPGVLPTIGYVDLRKLAPEGLATLIIQKLGPPLDQPHNALAARLPGQDATAQRDLRERAKRLAHDAAMRETREQFLVSQRARSLALAEVKALHEYLRTETRALSQIDPRIELSCDFASDGLAIVRSPHGSFTAFWSQELSTSRVVGHLYIREFDRAHFRSSYQPNLGLLGHTHASFDVDENLSPGWRDESSPKILLTTQQLADRFLSRVVDRTFGVTVGPMMMPPEPDSTGPESTSAIINRRY